MPDVKGLEALTEWLPFDLEDGLAAGAGTVRLRLRHIDSLDAADELIVNDFRSPATTVALAMSAVAAWDLTEAGKPIPVTDEAKARFLRPLLGQVLKETEEEKVAREEAEKDPEKPMPKRRVFAYEIVEAAGTRSLFLKN